MLTFPLFRSKFFLGDFKIMSDAPLSPSNTISYAMYSVTSLLW
jgi:hypothetical protein